MAAATFNVWTIAKELQKRFNDPNAAWLTSAELGHLIGRYISVPETTVYFYKDTTGQYTTRGAWGSLALKFANETTPFTGSVDTTYEVDCMGTIQVTTGTSSITEPIAVTAALVDIGALTFEVSLLAASQVAKDTSTSVSGDGFSSNPVMPEDRLIKIGERYKGIR